ncbi:Protein ECM7 [Candida viswanathii]|uniref:Protein ECM7 n=1 Tax=Candida viswanathii TaxID=5486 RepID=A0A367Y1C1_9ASCO|nr:Protein ECM7 [Candida viswanathii]
MLLWKNISYNLTLPFRNLSPGERTLQIIRLLTCCASVAFCLACLVAPKVTNSAYVSRINCAHLDVSYGLYKSLRNSVSQTPEIFSDNRVGVSLGSSLTNSEITLISQYAEKQVAGAPQFCLTSLWSWCYGNYDTYREVTKNGKTKIKKKNERLTCLSKSAYAFDYLYELDTIGLTIILAYAYQSLSYRSPTYLDLMKSRSNRFQLSFNGIIFTCCAQFVILLFIFIIYGNRGSAKDLSKVPSFILHIVALISLASAVSIIIGLAIMTNLLIITRTEIRNKLGDFGVSFHMGKCWFVLVWVAASFSILSLASWVLPLWCANPLVERSTKDEEISLFQVGAGNESKFDEFKKKVGQTGKRITSRFSVVEVNEGTSRNHDHSNRISSMFHNRRPSIGLHNDLHEQEMRKLGESLSKKTSVRRTKSTSRAKELEEQGVLLENFTFKDDYPTIQEETYDGYSSRSVSRSALDKVRRKPSDKRERNLIREVMKSPFDDEDISPRNSYLEDDELELLDNQMFNLK